MSVSRFFPLAALGLALGSPCSLAADFTVTRLDDSNPPQPGMLRAAVAAANSTPGPDRILMPLESSVTLSAGELVISDATEIQGLGPAKTWIRASSGARVLSIVGDINHAYALDVVLRGLTLSGGQSSLGGGALAVLDFAKARVENSLILGNATDASGGGIYVYQSQLTLVDSVVRENTAADVGGAIAVEESQVNIERAVLRANTAAFGGAVGATGVTTGFHLLESRVEANTASNAGGGLALAVPQATVSASAIVDNTAEYTGGGLYFAGTAEPGAQVVQNTTVSGNAVNHEAGIGTGVAVTQGALLVRNSTVAANRAPAADVGDGEIGGGVYVAEGGYRVDLVSTILAGNTRGAAQVPNDLARGFGIEGPDSTLSARRSLIQFPPEAGVLNGSVSESLIGVDPLLQPLAYNINGGFTPTHALGMGSPACERGENSAGLPYDQRGAPWARSYGATDIGAYEYRADTIFFGDFENHPAGNFGCDRR